MTEPITEPMQYASGYTLDLYCERWTGAPDDKHEFREFPHQFIGENFNDCAKQARGRGWIIHMKTRTATCPKCTGKRRRA